jgi:hypothetical protein
LSPTASAALSSSMAESAPVLDANNNIVLDADGNP